MLGFCASKYLILFGIGVIILNKNAESLREPRPFHCTTPRPSGVATAEFMVECEDLTMNVTCSGKENIVITDAMYGRLVEGTVSCPDPLERSGTTSNTNCQSDVTSDVWQMCDGKSMCKVNVSNGVFGDPCGGTYKYLNVTYKCT